MERVVLSIDNPNIEKYLFGLASSKNKAVSGVIMDILKQSYDERLEDYGMLAALNEIPDEDNVEADSDELDRIFNGDFIKG